MSSMYNSNSLFELALNQMGLFAVTDAEGRYVFVNKEWENQTGIKADFAKGKYAYELIEGSSVLLAMRSGRPVSGELFLRTKTGVEIPAVVSYVPLFSDNRRNEAVGCIIFSNFADVEEAVKFSEKISEMVEHYDEYDSSVKRKNGAKYDVESIIGTSKAIKNVKEQIYMAAATSATVLIEGETGTGKELVAHAIHNASLRNIFPFVKVNCSAIPENLIESEFFGYEEGSFTGSSKGGRQGKFEKAHLGSIFLDEINTMSLAMQPKLLRVLQEKEIERIGASESIPIDVRVISASNKPLKTLIDSGMFRSDLFYRLNIITINLPPLRERKEDIPVLLDYYINKYNGEIARNVQSVSGEAMDFLMKYDYPGNVRELQNMIERAMNSTWSNTLDFRHFNIPGMEEKLIAAGFSTSKKESSSSFKMPHDVNQPSSGKGTPDRIPESDYMAPLSEQKAMSELHALKNALEVCGNNRSKAARMLGISRTMLYKKLEKYGIPTK